MRRERQDPHPIESVPERPQHPPQSVRRDEALPSEYLRGLALFNAGAYFEAHEVLEELWRHASGSERLFYHGLIQAAVALHHWHRGNERAARRVAERALARLSRLPSPFLALDVARLMADLRLFFEEPGASAPRLTLISAEDDPDLTS